VVEYEGHLTPGGGALPLLLPDCSETEIAWSNLVFLIAIFCFHRSETDLVLGTFFITPWLVWRPQNQILIPDWTYFYCPSTTSSRVVLAEGEPFFFFLGASI